MPSRYNNSCNCIPCTYEFQQKPPWNLKSPASRKFVQQLAQTNGIEDIKVLHGWCFVSGIHRLLVDTPQKVSVMRKVFLCYDVVMITAVIQWRTKLLRKAIPGMCTKWVANIVWLWCVQNMMRVEAITMVTQHSGIFPSRCHRNWWTIMHVCCCMHMSFFTCQFRSYAESDPCNLDK